MTTTSQKPRLSTKRTAPPRTSSKVTEDPTISCYKVLVPLNVADWWVDQENPTTHQRHYGDYLFEAVNWRGKALALYLRTQQIEQVFINKSELARWKREYRQRCREIDAEKAAVMDEEEELRQLEQRRREILAKKGLPFARPEKTAPHNSEGAREDFTPEKVTSEKIDFGGVKSVTGKPIQLPGVRRVSHLPNAAEIRTRPTKMLRKKA